MTRTSGSGLSQAVYYRYRDSNGRNREPVNEFVEGLFKTNEPAAAKIDDYVEAYLNGRPQDAPPPEYPISSQLAGELRELRIRFARTRYRLLYQRSRDLVILLDIIEKNSGAIPPGAVKTAQKRFEDYKERMDAPRRRPPRAAGRDAPPKTRTRKNA